MHRSNILDCFHASVRKWALSPPRIRQVVKGEPASIVNDGEKYACADAEFSLLTSGDCIVYSFGVAEDWSFEEDMEWLGCTVYAFDPTTEAKTGSRNGSIVFGRLGLAAGNYVTGEGWTMRELGEVVRRLGHAQRSLQYLKIDIEMEEWQVLRQQLSLTHEPAPLKRVEQLGIELHFWHTPPLHHIHRYRQIYRLFLDMQKQGWYPFSYQSNDVLPPDLAVPGWSANISKTMEVAWINTQCADRREWWSTYNRLGQMFLLT